MLQYGQTSEILCKVKKARHKRQYIASRHFYDVSIEITSRTVNRIGAVGEGGMAMNERGSLFAVMFWNWVVGIVGNTVNVLSATEFNTLKWLKW